MPPQWHRDGFWRQGKVIDNAVEIIHNYDGTNLLIHLKLLPPHGDDLGTLIFRNNWDQHNVHLGSDNHHERTKDIRLVAFAAEDLNVPAESPPANLDGELLAVKEEVNDQDDEVDGKKEPELT